MKRIEGTTGDDDDEADTTDEKGEMNDHNDHDFPMSRHDGHKNNISQSSRYKKPIISA